MAERTTTMLEQLRAMFQETVKAHHTAYQESGGEDPEWPLWYADHLMAGLGKILNATFTKSELIYLLMLVEKERSLKAPGSDWATYYARFFDDRYGDF